MSDDAATIETMIDDLERFGWTRVRATIWKSPDGRFFRGPFAAWRVARDEAGTTK